MPCTIETLRAPGRTCSWRGADVSWRDSACEDVQPSRCGQYPLRKIPSIRNKDFSASNGPACLLNRDWREASLSAFRTPCNSIGAYDAPSPCHAALACSRFQSLLMKLISASSIEMFSSRPRANMLTLILPLAGCLIVSSRAEETPLA